MASAGQQLHVDDTCQSRKNAALKGVIQRTFANVDTHEPDPQRDYDDDIERDEAVTEAQFLAFMKSGIPPKGTTLITWTTERKTELVLESNLQLLDRALFVGDVVKRDEQGFMRGSIVSNFTECTLVSAMPPNSEVIPYIRQVPSREIYNAHEYREEVVVVYNDWIGIIEDYNDEVTVRLENNSVVVVEDTEELTSRTPGDRFSVGDVVSTKKGNLRRGRWLFGAFNPNVSPTGVVVDTRTTWITVTWLCTRIGGRPAVQHVPGSFPAGLEPPEELDLDILNSGNVRIYDQSIPQSSASLQEYRADDFKIADRVKFRDLAGAMVKYSAQERLPDGQTRHSVFGRPRIETQGFDENVFLVAETTTRAKVLWQDDTVTEELTTALVPDNDYDIDNEVWPGEIVHSNQKRADVPGTEEAAENWGFVPAQVGVVQTVKPKDRIASVRWFPQATLRYLENDLMPGTILGLPSEEVEEVSLYDIRTAASLTRCRGDIVLLHSDQIEHSHDEASCTSDIDWLGEVIDIGRDGSLQVRLTMSKHVRDIRIRVEHVTLAYSQDMLHEHGDHDHDLDSSDDDISMASADEDDDEYNEMWYEYQDGTVREEDDGEDWSTEDEDEWSHDDGVNQATPSTPETSAASNPAAAPQQAEPTLPRTEYELSSRTNAPAAFAILGSAPPLTHRFLQHAVSVSTPQRMRRIQKEHKILRSSLPEGIFVRTWESRLDLVRVLIVGPPDTPYEYAPFLIDFHLCDTFPSNPPEAFFHSWTQGLGAVNPNLYEDGKICLSLLGTWHGDEKHENWSPAKSTLLQILVSLMGLVLVKQPYYNEAGYEVRAGAEETQGASALYSERALFRTRSFIAHALSHAIEGFEEEIKWVYLDDVQDGPHLLRQAIAAARKTIENSQAADGSGQPLDGLRKVSPGATIQLRRQVEALEQFLVR